MEKAELIHLKIVCPVKKHKHTYVSPTQVDINGSSWNEMKVVCPACGGVHTLTDDIQPSKELEQPQEYYATH